MNELFQKMNVIFLVSSEECQPIYRVRSKTFTVSRSSLFRRREMEKRRDKNYLWTISIYENGRFPIIPKILTNIFLKFLPEFSY